MVKGESMNIKPFSLLRAMQLKRAIRKKDVEEMYVGLLNDMQEREEDTEITAKRVKNILEEYKDILVEEITIGLPPVRKIEHSIELVLGEKPPSRPMYQLSPPELE